MYSALEAELKQQLPERKKVKKKMSKAQMQLIIIKKKQCDARALSIVEQLLESNVDTEWLLCNLKHINKSHMEDVIEERAIIKLCGYVLCNKSLTTMIMQQYHISTKKNKVYDISRRKNFCSSRCYGACTYLLEQMLTSPLWLRDKEDIPTFKFLTEKDELERSTPGDEVHVGGTDVRIYDEHEKYTEPNLIPEYAENMSQNKPSKLVQKTEDLNSPINEITSNIENTTISNTPETSVPVDLQPSRNDEKSARDLFNSTIVNNTNSEQHEVNDDNINQITTSVDNARADNIEEQDFKELPDTTCITEHENSDEKEDNENIINLGDHKPCSKMVSECDSNITEQDSEITLEDDTNHNENLEKAYKNIHKKDKHKVGVKSKKQDHKFYTLAMHIEQSVRQWITEDTLCLLLDEENTKNRLLENVNQHDRYVQVCKKLNKLQLEDGRDERTDLEKNVLKPLPPLSVLQEEGKKMELKVRAFFEGKMVVEAPKDMEEHTLKKNEDSEPILPLTDLHAPKALRRRIFLDKLNRILPDLLRALCGTRQSPTFIQYSYNNERCALIKVLVNSFSLSAKNIIFKTAEWTLVGLIIIKMLSVMDPQLKILLATKQATMYTSMILMSYKLDSNYLDRLIIELTNNPKIFDTSNNLNF